MTPLSLKRKILLLLLLIWIVLSFLSVFYNAVKSVSEAKAWLPLSDSEKRQKIFGNLHPFFIFIKTHTEKNSNILIFSDDAKTYYLGIYYLYPRIIYTTENIKEFSFLAKTLKYDYIAIFNNNFSGNNYKLIKVQNFEGNNRFQLLKRK
ncbi:MAG: hypothetical protein HYT08_00920 [Candidatus Levybacteria bacterium]|nr:hypothetical protein [Candidatus Levybacteria bacterium]